MAYQLPVGPWPLFGEKETTAVAFTGFSNPWVLGKKKTPFFFLFKTKKRKVPLPEEQLQSKSPQIDLSLCFWHLHTFYLFLSAPHKHVHTSFPLLLRGGGGEVNSQVQVLLSPVSLLVVMKDTVRIPSNYSVCEPPVSLPVHLLTELLNESQAGMLIKESDMLLEIWPSASRRASRTGGFVPME